MYAGSEHGAPVLVGQHQLHLLLLVAPDVRALVGLGRLDLRTLFEPGGEKASCGPAHFQLIDAPGEIAGVDFGGTHIFDALKT